METALAVVVKLLDAFITALKPHWGAIWGTVSGFYLGNARAEFKAMEEALGDEREASEFARKVDALHASLDDDGVRQVASERIKRLRYKARTTHGIGGHDD